MLVRKAAKIHWKYKMLMIEMKELMAMYNKFMDWKNKLKRTYIQNM